VITVKRVIDGDGFELADGREVRVLGIDSCEMGTYGGAQAKAAAEALLNGATLITLRVQDVNFLGRSVRIGHQLDEHTRGRVEPKTPRSRRTIPLPKVAADALAAHIAEHPPLPDGTLFSGGNGRPYAHSYYTRLIKTAVRRLADAKGSMFPPETTSHDLRHHYASVLLAAGESVVAVAERLGHDDATMVIRVYGHLLPDSEDRTRKAVDQAWSSGSGEAPTAQGRPG
jgi:site-specific recombinase XerC